MFIRIGLDKETAAIQNLDSLNSIWLEPAEDDNKKSLFRFINNKEQSFTLKVSQGKYHYTALVGTRDECQAVYDDILEQLSEVGKMS